MKIRKGFVSNSSSSSFILNRKNLTYEQECLISKLCDETNCGWLLFNTYGSLIGYTYMDNFDIAKFFDKIGVKKTDVYWASQKLSKTPGQPSFDNPNWQDIMQELDKQYSTKLDIILKDMNYTEV